MFVIYTLWRLWDFRDESDSYRVSADFFHKELSNALVQLNVVINSLS